MSNIIKAFDISHHNGQEIKKLLSRPEDAPAFLYIKRSEGISIVQDEYYHDLFVYAKERGIICGGYHYINPCSNVKFNDLVKSASDELRPYANTEASRLLHIVDTLGCKLVPMMDVEEKYLVYNMCDCLGYLDMVCNSYFTQGGKKLGIYASHSVLNTPQMADLISRYNLVIWDARYKYTSAKLCCDSTLDDIDPLTQPCVNNREVSINQICTKYVDYDNKTWSLDCDIVYRPLDLLL